MNKMCGIYQITNNINKKTYIGSSIDIMRRWAVHITQLNNNNHPNQKLQHSWNKHGEKSFIFTILSLCEHSELLVKEQAAMDLFQPWFNIQPLAGVHQVRENNGMYGKQHSKETLEKMSSCKKGKPKSEETKAKMRAARAKITQETALGIRDKVKQSPEARLARSERCKGSKPAGLTMAGKQHSEETKAKMSASQSGKPVSEEARQKISAKLKGVHLSEEHKSNMRKAPRPKQSAEQVAKRVAARKATLGKQSKTR